MSHKLKNSKKLLNSARFSKVNLAIFIIVFAAIGGYALLSGQAASSPSIYVAQTSAGTTDGSSCANAKDVTFFNTAANWGAGSTQIGPGTTVHLCGTITANLTAQGSGVSGSPITIFFEPNAKLSQPYCSVGCLVMSSRNYITVDGGQNGVIENTDNGTNLTYQQGSNGITASPCNHCTVENLTIQNMYVHAGTGSEVADNITHCIVFQGTDWTIVHNVFHDVSWCLREGLATGDTNIHIENNEFYNFNHGWALGGTPGDSVGDIWFDHNHMHDMANWDNTTDSYHHDGIHCYSIPSGGLHINNYYIYDNNFDGDPGVNVTGWVYLEHTANAQCADDTSKIWVFNNKASFDDRVSTNPIFGVNNGEFFFANNTVQGGDWDGLSPTSYCTNLISTQTYYANNAIGGCDGLKTGVTPTSATLLDYNAYSACKSPYHCFGWNNSSDFAAYQSAGNEPHSVANLTAAVGSNAAGVGQNLTSMCTGDLIPLCSDIYGNPRPTTGAWDAGAVETTPIANVWVSTTGDDSTCARGNPDKPCLTLDKAYQLAQCADTIQVAAGTYNYQIIQYDATKTATEACRITIQPVPGGTPTFAALWVAADYITVKNMTVPDNGCTGSCDVTVEGVVGDTGSGNGHIWISSYPYSNGHTPDNDIIDGGSAPYFDLHCATNATVENGNYGPNYDYASHPSWGGASCQSYAKNINILNNDIHDVILRQTGAHTNCMAAYNFDGLTISGNKIHGCENIAFRANWQSAWTHAPNGYNDNLIFENNMIWDGTISGGNTVQFVNPGGTYTVRGNSDLSTVNSLGAAVSWDISTVPGIDPNLSFNFYGNIIPRFGANDCNLTGVKLDYNIYTNPGGGNPDTGWPTCGPHDKTSTPDAEFINTTIPDLHLKSTAVAIGAGNPASCPSTDIDGDSRPQGTACDAGADEYTTGGGSITPGDLNSDGHVNITDLSIMLSHYGQTATASQGDINGDTKADIFDLSILLSHYGS